MTRAELLPMTLEKEEIIHAYIAAYNAFDKACRLSGSRRKRVRIFSERKQTIQAIQHYEDRTEVAIDLAADANGRKKKQVLQ